MRKRPSVTNGISRYAGETGSLQEDPLWIVGLPEPDYSRLTPVAYTEIQICDRPT